MESAGPSVHLKKSHYLLISPRCYRSKQGEVVRLGYAARTARVVTMAASSAESILSGQPSFVPPPELAALIAAEALVPAEQDEQGEVLRRLSSGSADMSFRQITIMPTSYCNMACSYCGQEHRKSSIDSYRINRLAERVEGVISDPGVSSVRVSWFGGEPLMAFRVIRELSERFIRAAQANNVNYVATMATNGSLLTSRTLHTLYYECLLRAVDVTIDGPADVHNARRRKKNATGSFHHITRLLADAIKEGQFPSLRINIRTNVDMANEESLEELYYDLACMGFGSAQVHVSLMPVHSWGNDVSDVEVGAQQYAAKEAKLLTLARRLGLEVSFLPTRVKSTTCLATSRSGELLDSEGRVYSCSEHPLVPKVADSEIVARVEDLTAASPRPVGRFDNWYASIGAGEVPCTSCPLLPVCGGSCPKLWRDGHIPCPSIKHNWQQRLDLIAEACGYEVIPEAAIG